MFKKLFTIATLSLIGLSNVNAQVCFEPPTNFAVPGRNLGICSADFNMDGKPDLATTNYSSNNISVLLGNGLGSFTTTNTFAVGAEPWQVTSADFNGDTKLDLAVTNYGDNTISILLGDGTGNFSAGTNFVICSCAAYDGPMAIISRDFNGDTKLDLAVTNNVGAVSILLGDGTGSFGSPNSFAVGSGNPYAVISADFNGDGTLDLAVANSGSNNVSILLGNGAGSFSTALNFVAGTGPVGIASADFNMDGKLDLVTGNATSGNVSVLLGDGAGNFGTAANYGPTGTYAQSVISADFNMDGKPDIAVGNYGNDNVSVLLNTSTSTVTASFLAPTNFAVGSPGNASAVAIVSADFDMNGKPDIATANDYANNVSILLNNGVSTVLNITGNTAICAGGSTTLTASGGTTYTWSANTSSATTNTVSVSPAVNTGYTVTAGGAGCNAIATTTVTVGAAPVTPMICMVTTDSATNYNYNVIYWTKTDYHHVDSFLVYRKDNTTGIYLRIGAVSKDSLSKFIDTAFSIGGPNGGNPQWGNYQYKLAIKDTCGNISSKSPYHQTTFVSQSGSQFSFSSYIDSGQVGLPTGYALYRDNNNTGNWHQVSSTSSSPAVDPTYASFPSGNWRVDAQGFGCTTPTLRLAGGGNNSPNTIRVRSHSNTSRQANTTGITKLASSNEVSIYPNPASTSLTLRHTSTGSVSDQGTSTLQITDMLGNTVKQSIIYNLTSIINVAELAEGIYNLSISSNGGVVNKRLVIVR